jgi:hypothetical protein
MVHEESQISKMESFGVEAVVADLTEHVSYVRSRTVTRCLYGGFRWRGRRPRRHDPAD